nr:myosin-11 isoform X1 [Tanacetum cinerariifolium]
LPFSVDDISKSMLQVDICDIEPPPLIRKTKLHTLILVKKILEEQSGELFMVMVFGKITTKATVDYEKIFHDR